MAPQHDYTIDNNAGRNVRLDINAVLAAIVSNNSGDTEPTDTFPYMFWFDSDNDILKMRNADDDAWIDLFYFTFASGFVGLSAAGTELLRVDGTAGAVKLLGVKGTYLPSGTTAERPTGTNGIIRYNSTLKVVEAYANGAWTSLSSYTGYTAVVGSGAFCTHADLATALADSGVAAGSRILVTESQTIDTTISITKANIQIDFLPGVTFTQGAATTGITVGAAGCRIKGGRFSGFTTAISISSSYNYNFITECRFASCTNEVTEVDSAPNNIIANNISE